MDHFITEIDDGYTLPFNLNAIEGLHPGLSGQRRPMMVDERDTMFAKGAEKKNRAERNAFYRRVLAGKLVTWDAKTDKGAELPPTAESLRFMPPALWDKFFELMIGERPSDVPESKATSADTGFDELDAAMEAARRGHAPENGLEAARKN